MIKAPVNLQDLRRKIYVKAKTESSWRFWGLYVHVCKEETLREAYRLAEKNNGAPGIDGVTFEAIEMQGVEDFLKQIQNELIERTYVPLRARKQEIPKDGTKVRVLSIPAIRDRVVQGALKLIMEPIFFLRPTFKRDRLDIVRRGLLMRLWIGWLRRSCSIKHVSLTSTSAPILITCGTMCCSARWRSVLMTRM
jgi:hypothetical protein